jgi:UPF0716 family protein affecting phage T7 exclusion
MPVAGQVRLNAFVVGSWIGFTAGLAVIVTTFSSVVGTLVVPRSDLSLDVRHDRPEPAGRIPAAQGRS